jgi:hypothetical protein
MEFAQTARFHFVPIQPILRYLCFLNPFSLEICRSLLLFSWLSSLREAAIAFELLRKTTTEDFTALRHAWALREMHSQPIAHLSIVIHFNSSRIFHNKNKK